MVTKVLIKRNDYPSDTYVLSEGEMAFAIKTGEFFVICPRLSLNRHIF